MARWPKEVGHRAVSTSGEREREMSTLTCFITSSCLDLYGHSVD